MLLNERTELRGDVTVLRFSGKITIGRGDITLRDAVDAALKAGAMKLLLDLTDVSYIDSAGMGEIVAAYVRVLKDQKKPYKVLIRASSRVADLFDLQQADTWLSLYSDESAALASFK